MDVNKILKDLIYVRRIVANKKIDPETGEKVLKPEGYDTATIREGSLWFITQD